MIRTRGDSRQDVRGTAEAYKAITKDRSLLEGTQRHSQLHNNNDEQPPSAAPWLIPATWLQRLIGLPEGETPQTCLHIYFLQNLYRTLHASTQHSVGKYMKTNCNEITCTSASSHRLQQHCLYALEIRTHTKCCMLESMFEARILKFATIELSYVACTSNIGNHNKHLHLKQYAYNIFFTHR